VSEGSQAGARVEEILSTMDDIVVAASGGVDSLTLATLAGRTPGLRAAVAHAVSPAVPAAATARVRRLARREGWRLLVLDAGEFEDPAYRANPVDRCRYCKRSLYGAIRRASGAVILSGTNLDDLGDYRPGLEAAAEHGVRHPFVEAGVDKAGVRGIARALGLEEIADLPAAPCLASRVETGIRIEADLLAFVDRAERAVRDALGATIVRARVRRDGLVVELDPDALGRARDGVRRDLERTLQELGPDPLVRAGVRFAPYEMGSAFVHARQSAGAPRPTGGGAV